MARADAAEYGAFVRGVDVTWQKLVNRKDPLQPNIPSPKDGGWEDHVAVSPKIEFLKYGFFDSEWYYDSAYQKVQEVGLKIDAGVHVGPWFDLLYNHESIHSCDTTNAYNDRKDYELRDAVGIRVHLYAK